MAEPRFVDKPPSALNTNLTRSYQCVSLIKTTVEVEGKRSTLNPLSSKGAAACTIVSDGLNMILESLNQ